MDGRQIIYYTDELHDEFSTFTTTPPRIDGSYAIRKTADAIRDAYKLEE